MIQQPVVAPAGALSEKLGIEWVETAPERVIARMPVEGNTQPYGILHGGATAGLCETVASIGTALAVGMEKRVMGIELNVNHIRAAREGTSTASQSTLRSSDLLPTWRGPQPHRELRQNI